MSARLLRHPRNKRRVDRNWRRQEPVHTARDRLHPSVSRGANSAHLLLLRANFEAGPKTDEIHARLSQAQEYNGARAGR